VVVAFTALASEACCIGVVAVTNVVRVGDCGGLVDGMYALTGRMLRQARTDPADTRRSTSWRNWIPPGDMQFEVVGGFSD
jgi:hypothetical protein